MPRSPTFRFDHDAPADWAPLERLAELCRERRDLPDLDPDAFMYMGRAVRPSGPPVLMYKHIWTRRYLKVDQLGHAYAMTVTGGPRLGDLDDLRVTCRPFGDLASALAWVHRDDEHLASR